MSGRFRMPLIVASLLLACGVATVTARAGNSDAANTHRKQARRLPPGGFQNR